MNQINIIIKHSMLYAGKREEVAVKPKSSLFLLIECHSSSNAYIRFGLMPNVSFNFSNLEIASFFV